MTNPTICSMHSVMQLVLHACLFLQLDEMPIAFYITEKSKAFYLTGNKFAELLRKVVWKVCQDTTTDNLKKYSANFLCVWACILCNETRKSPKYMKKRLSWLGNSFRMYLRDTTIIQYQHIDALQAASQEVMDFIAALPKDVIALCSMADGSDNPDIHKNGDNMGLIIW
jgi:hypothetical protein